MRRIIKSVLALALAVMFVASCFSVVSAADVRTFAESPKFMEWNSPETGVVFLSSFEGEQVDADGNSTVEPNFDGAKFFDEECSGTTTFWENNMPYGFVRYNDVKYKEAEIFTPSWTWAGKSALGFTDPDIDSETGIRSRFLKAVAGETYRTTSVIVTRTPNAENSPMTIKLAFEFWNDDLEYLGESSIDYTRGLGKEDYYNGYAKIDAEAPEGTSYMTILLSSPKGSAGECFIVDNIFVYDINCAVSRDDALKNPSHPSEADDKIEKDWLANHSFNGKTDIKALGDNVVIENRPETTTTIATTTTLSTSPTTTAGDGDTAAALTTTKAKSSTTRDINVTTTTGAADAETDSESSNTWIFIVIAAAIVVIVVIVIIIVSKKKKNKAE